MTYLQPIPEGIQLRIIREALSHYRNHILEEGLPEWMEDDKIGNSEVLNYAVYDTMTLESLFHHPVQVILTKEEVNKFEHLSGHMTGLPMYTNHPLIPQE